LVSPDDHRAPCDTRDAADAILVVGEIGYAVVESQWNRGYATAASRRS